MQLKTYDDLNVTNANNRKVILGKQQERLIMYEQ